MTDTESMRLPGKKELKMTDDTLVNKCSPETFEALKSCIEHVEKFAASRETTLANLNFQKQISVHLYTKCDEILRRLVSMESHDIALDLATVHILTYLMCVARCISIDRKIVDVSKPGGIIQQMFPIPSLLQDRDRETSDPSY